MSEGIAVQLAEISLRRGRGEVLRSVSLTVAENQVALITGANGAGKTSLLRVLAGLERPTGGRGTIAGHDLASQPIRVRRAASYVPEFPSFEAELTATEQLAFHARLAGLGLVETRSTVGSMLELLDLTDLRSRLPDALSRGQRQRLAIGRALVRDPSILLLDEPLLGLDEGGKTELAAVLDELRALGKTLVLASRAPGELVALADAIYSLADGALTPASTAETPSALCLRLAVLGEGERVRDWLARRPDVVEARLDESAPDGPARLSVRLQAPDPAVVAELVRSIVEHGESVVEVYSEPEEVAV